MAKPIRGIDIYLPLDYNDGRPIPDSKFRGVEHALLERFGGVTVVQRTFPLQEVWRAEEQVYSDRVVVFTAMDYRGGSQLDSIRYLERLKTRLKKKFDQLEILITVAEMLAI
jgi:hypothetical protein